MRGIEIVTRDTTFTEIFENIGQKQDNISFQV